MLELVTYKASIVLAFQLDFDNYVAGAMLLLFIIVAIKGNPEKVPEIEFVDTSDIVTRLLFSSVIGLGSR